MIGLTTRTKKVLQNKLKRADQKVFYVYWFFNSPSKLHSKSNSFHYIWRGLYLVFGREGYR